MIVNVSAVVVDADPQDLSEMSAFLSRLGVDVVAQLETLDSLPPALAGSTPPELVVVKLDPDPHASVQRLEPLIASSPGTHFFAMSETVDAELVIEAMSVGVREFIELPVRPERIRKAVERLGRSRKGGNQKAKLITFVPTSGGCGSTTPACNVAVTLAKKGRCALIDLDLAGGSVAEALDLRPRFSIADLTGARVDQTLVDNALVIHKPSGLSVLSRPEAPEDAAKVTGESLRRLLATMSDSFDYLVVDSQLSMEPAHATAARASDLIVLVVQLTVPSLRNAARYLEALRRNGVNVGDARTPGVVRVVANRYGKKSGEVKVDAAEKALGQKLDWLIPNDYRSAIAATNYGDPVVLRSPKSEVSASLGGLAHLLNGRQHAGAETPA